MRSTGHAWSYKAWCSAVISCFSTALIGAFRSLLFTQWFAPSAVRCRTALLLLCFLIVGIHDSEISIPLSLLLLLRWSLTWIASLTLRVYSEGHDQWTLLRSSVAYVRCCGHALKRRRSRYGRVECLLFLQERKRITIRNQNIWQMFFLLGDDGGFCYETFSAFVKALNNTGLYWLRVVLIMR